MWNPLDIHAEVQKTISFANVLIIDNNNLRMFYYQHYAK